MITRNAPFNPEEVEKYYKYSNWWYRLICYDSTSLGMHYGFWEKDTRNRQEAINNESLYIAYVAGMNKNMHILDVGCGVGGAAIAIAVHTGARITGITIDPQQVDWARKNAQARGLSHIVDFQLQDYYSTNFLSNTFDVVYGIESVCYASPKQKFLQEAYRILKKGGKLVVADGYLSRDPRVKEYVQLEQFMKAFTLPELVTTKEMTEAIRSVGFRDVEAIPKMNFVRPSTEYFYKLSRVTRPFTWILSHISNGYLRALHSNNTAVLLSGIFARSDLADYRVHVGIKPT